MKALLRILIICTVSAFGAFAQDADPHVAVFGTATVEVVPDEMHWSLNVTTRGPEVAGVAAAHDRKVAGVITFLKDNSIEEEKIQTSRISLSESWTYRDRNRVKDGYVGSTTIMFESGDLDKYRDLWMGLAALTDINVNGVSFDTSERIKHQHATRARAVRDARQKATELAEALDAWIGEPLLISENLASMDGPHPVMARSAVAFEAAGAAPDGPSISPGTISITTHVAAKFRLHSK